MLNELKESDELRQVNNESKEYLTDDRSGDEVSDSDQDFDSIIQIQEILDKINGKAIEEKELQDSFISLLEKLYALRELTEYNSEPIKNALEAMSREFIHF